MLSFRTTILIYLLLSVNILHAQFVPISLNQRIENSTAILEGKVISQASYWDETKTHIYTSNIIEVYKIFKGDSTSKKVEMITVGGVVGDKVEYVTNMLTLKIGDTGVFTAIPNTQKLSTKTELPRLKTYAGIQGFIKYNLESGIAADLFNEYKDIDIDLYQKITNQTKLNIKIIQKAPFKPF